MATISDLTAEFLDTFDQDTQKRTVQTYRQGLKTFIDIVGDHSELTEETYIRFLKNTRTMTASTQAAYRSAVAGLYGYASFKKIIPPLSLKPATKYHGKKQGTRNTIDPDMDAIGKVITYANTLTGDLISLRDRAFVLVLADTGLRISEACGLKRGQINWNEGRGVVIGKGDKQAVIRLSERAIRAVQDYLHERAKLDGASGKQLSSLPVFARHDISAKNTLKPVTAKGMWKAIRQRINESGVEEPEAIRIHDFRHYFVSTIIMATGNLKLAQTLARHDRIETTNRYAHLGGQEDEAYHKIFNSVS